MLSPLARRSVFLPLAMAIPLAIAATMFSPATSAIARAGEGPAQAGRMAPPREEIPAPRLVRVTLDAALPLERLLEAGFDVIESHPGLDALVLEWPLDEARLAELGARVEVVDATPGETMAARSRADLAARPRQAAPARIFGTKVLPAFGSGSMGGYWTLDEVKLKLDQLVANDTRGLVADKIDTLGYSVQGRPIWGLKLGAAVANPDTRPLVYYNALTHAREPEGMQALFYFVDDILGRYSTDPWATYLLNQRVLYIVPVVNPDGFQININTYVNSGGLSFGLWRKNARDNDANGVINGSDGVDINRNYGFQWGIDNLGSSPTPSTETYRGPSAFSEVETRAQRDAVIALHPRTAISFHTYSDLMLYPWGYTLASVPDSAAFQEWTDIASIGDGYQTGPSPRVLYGVNGEFNDWAYGETVAKPRVFSWTPEVGNHNDGFYPLASRIVPLAKENLRRCYFVAAIAGPHVRIERALISEGTLDIGALAHFSIRARNVGLAAAGPNLAATLVSLDPGAQVFSGALSYPDLASLTSGDALGGATFAVATADTLTPGRLVRFEVDFTADGGFFSRDTLAVPAGRPTLEAADNANAGLGGWGSLGWSISGGDAIHPAPYFTDSPLGAYGSNANSTLTLLAPLALDTGVHAYATFHTRWDLETGYDDALVEGSLDGVNWTALGGPGSSIGTVGSQPTGVPLYQGTRERWAGERVDLSPLAGPSAHAVRLRFHLSSDPSANFDGFSFDSLRVELYDPAMQPAPVAVGGPAPTTFALAPVSPNPARDAARFSFTLPREGVARLEIVDLAGRRVRLLADGPLRAERYVRGWDLRDERGGAVAPGVYLARLSAGSLSTTRRVVVLR